MSGFMRFLIQKNGPLIGLRLLAQNQPLPSCMTTQVCGLLTTKKEVSRDVLAFIQQEIDLRPVAIKRWKRRKEWEMLVNDHKLNPERAQVLGCDLAIAHFIIARGGAVRFCEIDHWFEPEHDGTVPKTLPNIYHDAYKLEAVDASNTDMMYCSFDNIDPVPTLRYLNLSNCKYIDDWCLDRLSTYRHSLQFLDLSGCPKVTERGLATLHRLSKLRRLHIENMPRVRNKPLIGLMLEEALPDCLIEGVDIDGALNESNDQPEKQSQDVAHSFEEYEKKLITAIQTEITGKYFHVANIRF